MPLTLSVPLRDRCRNARIPESAFAVPKCADLKRALQYFAGDVLASQGHHHRCLCNSLIAIPATQLAADS